MDTTTDPRAQYLRALDQLEKLVARITPEMLERPTPCPAYDLRALLGHTVGGVHQLAYLGEGGRWVDVAGATGPIADGDWADALVRARERMVRAWADDALLAAPVHGPGAVMPGRDALDAWVMETVTHTWDLTRAVDPTGVLDEELGRAALATAHRVMPDAPRGGPVPFGPVRPAPADADPTTELATWLGRKA